MTAGSKITPLQLERLALICAADGPAEKLAADGEQLQAKAGLIRLAKSLGWPSDRIVTVESLAGDSKKGWSRRAVWERLVDAVSEWRVGAVLGLESSGLTRNAEDRFELIDACWATGTLLVDGERIRAPASQSHPVVLGNRELSEFETWIVSEQVMICASRHDPPPRISTKLPAAYVQDGLAIRKHPDLAVRDAVLHVAETVRAMGSSQSAARALRHAGYSIPHSPWSEESLDWKEATADGVRAILQSPCMAGAFIYGRRRLQLSQEERESPRRVLSAGIERDRYLLVMDHHEPYFGWDEWIQLQDILSREFYSELQEPIRWEGSRLLIGLAVCGCCGRPVTATSGEDWRYECEVGRHPRLGERLPILAGLEIDSKVVSAFLRSVAEGGFEASRRAVARFPAMQDRALRRCWLELDRHEYRTALRWRRHITVGPEHEFVARELARALRTAETELDEARMDFSRIRAERPDLQVPSLLERFARLGARLETVWNATSITDDERRKLLTILLEKVELHWDAQPGWALIRMYWKGGSTSDRWLPVPKPDHF